MRPLFERSSRLVTVISAALLLPCIPIVTHAQYFGRNKVQYNNFDFRVLPTDHFQVFYYPAESLATADAARMAERWYTRHNELLNKGFAKNPLIFYADPPDFQQSNVVEGTIEQGIGGITEGAKDRVIMPFTGSYADNEHVLGHELVHVFQYHIAESTHGGMANVDKIPLWLIEGMAEYLSLGRDDPNTAMWLRDAMRRNDLPSIKQLTNSTKYFPYRYGQALWAYIGGVWGDEAVSRIYRAALERDWEGAIKVALGMSQDSLSKRWQAAIRDEYGKVIAGRTAPNDLGRAIIAVKEDNSQNVSPAVSPDGKYVAFFSSRGLFGMDLYVAETATGRVVKQLTSVTRNPHFDDLSFIASAGSWSPDAKKFAFVVYANGDNELDIIDVDSKNIERTVRVPGVGAMADAAWSPDGKEIAFSGLKGGISDIYLYHVDTQQIEQLTADREAQMQPAWSPDGKTIAFATDAGEETNFDKLEFGKMRIGMMDVATREVKLLPRFGIGKEINPQYSPDGQVLYFVGDQDGVPDIYRMTLATGEVLRITRVATGVSGITATSPTLSVARQSGDLVFSVFDRQGFGIRTLTPQEALGTVVTPVSSEESAGLLPPIAAVQTSVITRALHDPSGGLPAPKVATVRPVSNSLQLDYVGGPQAGVQFGGPFGTGVVGGVAFGFSDVLGNHLVNAAVQANGTVKDFGGDVFYLNRAHRWNWGAEAYHIPIAYGYANYDPVNSIYTEYIQRDFFENASLLAQYPLSATRRLEFSGGFQHIGFDIEADSFLVDPITGATLGESRGKIPAGTGLTFWTGSAAYVFDNSYFGFTSPIAGGRYRIEVSPSFGSFTYQTVLADYRQYFFFKPFTLAIRAIHYGRYGSERDTLRLGPIAVGQPALIRGYDVYNFDPSVCTPTAKDGCPQLSRLFGSKVGAINIEFRIPLFGTDRFGLLNVPFLPTEVSPFLDVGGAWSNNQPLSLRFNSNTTDRVPIVSTGISTRFNVLGFAVLEVFWAHPYQTPGKNWYVGFQLAPGW